MSDDDPQLPPPHPNRALDNDLFTGVDDTDSTDSPTEDDPVFSGGAPVDGAFSMDPRSIVESMLREQIRHLTYAELHAFGLGFMVLYIGMVLQSGALVSASIGLSLAATGCRKCLPYRLNDALEYIIKEPHYLYLGTILALVAGGLTVALASVLTFIVGVVA